MKILVFGGAGFLGSYVVDELVSRGHDVTIFDRRKSPYHGDEVTTIVADILDRDAVNSAVNGHEVVYNFAGQPDIGRSVEFPVETIEANVRGNLYILEACRQSGIERFIYASTAYVFSQKGGFYGTSKKCSERIIEEYSEQYGLNFTIIRYGSVYGERADKQNRIYKLLHSALLTNRIVFPGDGSEEREYIHGRDAARLSVDILDSSFQNQHIILTGMERYQYSDVLHLISEILGNKVDIEFLSAEYKGHYKLTPYSFNPTISRKLVNNPSIDFAQGLLQCVEHLYYEIHGSSGSDADPGIPAKTMVFGPTNGTIGSISRPPCLMNMDVAVLAGTVDKNAHHILGETPPILAPIGLRSYLDYLLDWLVSYGARRVVLCLGEGFQRVLDHLAANPRKDITIETSIEETPQGTAGALRYARDILRTNPVLVLNGDSFVSADLSRFIVSHEGSGLNASILCTRVDEAGRFGLVELDQDGQRVTTFREKPVQPGMPGVVNAGVYLFSADLLDEIASNGATSLEEDILQQRAPGTISAFVGDFPFCDVGIPEDLARAHEFFCRI